MAISSMLVPVSTYDDRDAKVLQYACGLWEQSVRRLLVATAVESEGVEAPVIPAEMDRARQRLAAMAQSTKGCSMEIEWRVVAGDTTAGSARARLTSGRGRHLLRDRGQVARRLPVLGLGLADLVTSGHVRTMTVRYDLLDAAEDPSQLARDFARRLVIPTDFSASASRAFLSAFDRPVENIDTLFVIHVLPETATENERFEAEVMLRGVSAIAREHGVDCHTELRTGAGDPEEVVLAYLEEVNATGVITGRKGRGRLTKAVLGSLAVQLLRDAPCPVVVQP